MEPDENEVAREISNIQLESAPKRLRRLRKHPSASSANVRPPSYAPQPHVTEHHGDVREDQYFWLRDRSNPSVKRLLEQENAYTKSFYQQHHPSLQRTLYQEMRQRWKEDDASLPVLDRSYWYYSRQVAHAEYPLFCRRPYDVARQINVNFLDEVSELWRRDPNASLPLFEDEVIFLDINLLLKELRLRFIEVGDMDISPDETKVAVTLDCSNGKEIFTVFVLPIDNVNYARWIEKDASAVHRAVVQQLVQSGQSMYTSPTAVSSRSSPSQHSPRKVLTTTKRTSKRAHGKSAPPPPPQLGSFPRDPDLQSAPPVDATAAAPRHRIHHRIDMFDNTSEVLWVSDTALMYVAMDEKMRPCEVVYHDLTYADDDAAASVVCYAEEDESFWVGSLCFTADERFLLFSSASSEVSEWYFCPLQGQLSLHDPSDRRRLQVKGIPVVYASSLEAKDPAVPLHDLNNASVICFSPRQTQPPREYSVDHHGSLLAPNAGGWVVTSDCNGCTNFAVFYVSDEAVHRDLAAAGTANEGGVAGARGEPTRHLTTQWHALFAYEPSTKVESVTCMERLLLINVRRAGTPTELFCPIQLLWRWWAAHTKAAGSPRPLQLTALIDLASLLERPTLSVSSGGGAVVDEADAWEELHFSVSEQLQRAAAYGTRVEMARQLGSQEDVFESDHHHSARALFPHLKATRLLSCVDSYTGTTSFYSREWRVVVSHLIRPTLQYHFCFEPPVPADCTSAPPGEGSSSSCCGNDTDVALGTLKVKKIREEVVNGPAPYRETDYEAMVVWVPSAYSFVKQPRPDATPVCTKHPMEAVHIPLFVCWKRSLFVTGGCPAILNVYGSYGDCCDPEFSTERLSLLDRGFVWATAAVRGGGDLGITWRDAGRKLQRATTVNDFLSVASYMQDQRLCAPQRLISCGGSAGGFVVFMAMNQAPHLFHGVIGAVPFVDCLSTLLDAELPLTVTEWEEYGNPAADPEAYRYIKALSPTDTVPSAEDVVFPHILMETAWGDSRVGFWESLKLTARLRELWPKKSEGLGKVLLHYCDFDAGHGGATGRYEQLREIAREYAFAIAINEKASLEAAEAFPVTNKFA